MSGKTRCIDALVASDDIRLCLVQRVVRALAGPAAAPDWMANDNQLCLAHSSLDDGSPESWQIR